MLSVAEIAKSIPDDEELSKILYRKNILESVFSTFSAYKKTEHLYNVDLSERIEAFVKDCYTMGFSKLNSLMLFFYYHQPIFVNDANWELMDRYLQENKLIHPYSPKAFKTTLVAFKWISAYRLSIQYIREEMEGLNYDESWKSS